MNSMRHLAWAAFALGWLFAGTPAFAACEGSSAANCTYPIASTETKGDDKKAERKTGNRREGRRRSARSGRYRHRSAYRSSRRWNRYSRRSRYQRFAGRHESRRQNEDEVAAVSQEATTPAPIVNADDATVQVLPQAMETGTSLSPVPQNQIASALNFHFGPRASEAAPAQKPTQMAQATPTVSTVRVVQSAGPSQQAAEMQTSNVGQAASAPPQESDGFFLRAMFLTLAGALTLATAVRLVIG